ncbi:rho GTPase-activating protein 27-like [Uloborus diversus]|uniref:rho GTPase-activating protein 27-like n=1 Tax=Uloborus diversus TaxID=327109 RepID=UPI00240A4E0D|nr:rho GTPase-activating protein 27-like [Uloborus diversus]
MSEVYVQVLYDYNYRTDDGNEVKIKAGEELLLVERLNENWWQVIRNHSEYPFYAPSNYLSVIGFKCNETTKSRDVNSNFAHVIQKTPNQRNVSNDELSNTSIRRACEQKSKKCEAAPKSTMESLSFRNPLCTDGFSNNEADLNQDVSNHVPFTTELNKDQKRFLSDSAANENSISQDSLSPIYVNIPLSLGRLPPIPKAEQAPLRSLSNDWFEYVDEESGRKYYFHSLSGKVTWKPPRRRENMHSTPLNSEPSSPQSLFSSNVPEPPPKQLKPKLKKLAHSSNESLESQTSPCMFTILPPGWSQESDSSGIVYYQNEASRKKWFSSLDDNGRTYFYDEDSSESVWELPDLSTVSDTEESKQGEKVQKELSQQSNEKDRSQEMALSKSTTEPMPAKLRKRAPKLPVPRQFKTRSLVVPECVNLAGAEDNKGYLPASFGEGYWPSVQDGHFSITRKGTLNKTKLVEGGKRIRKNWTSSFVVLTDVFLLFYKDIRSAHLATPGMKPELCIDLNGALVEWCPEKSSRKNVFQISTVLGHQLLLQDDNAQTTKEWFDTIQAAIMMLPSSLEQNSLHGHDESSKKDVKLSRSKSTKQYSSKANNEENDLVIPAEKKRKIRDKLRQFFVRRPTLESLREKGILLDEPVFGCHLETLCSRENRTVPKFVSKCIEVIEKKELTADGLYRASGNLSQVQKIRIHVNQDDYSCLELEEDVHVLTGALKMFFREMKEPLFPFNMFGKFLNAIALPDASSKLVALKELVSKLPEPNYETLKVLFEHLLRVTKYHKQNRMQIQNLAIVFGPTLMCSEQMSNNIALDMMHQNRIVEFLLLEFNAIFCVNSTGQAKNK